MNHRSTLLAAGLFGATGVVMGLLERGTTVAWETAARYQLLHAVALAGAAAWLRQATGVSHRRVGWAALGWVIGIVLFSGSLYGLAAGGPRWLGPVTPLGGLALLGGWLSLAVAAFAKET
jgi:uncharacterized membrane protein YgdD (TMEM256/DUF423 family)